MGVGSRARDLRAVGKRGRSGKAVNPTRLGGVECYGFRGEGESILAHDRTRRGSDLAIALASIGALGILEITSKTTESKETFRKIIKVS